MVNAINMNQMLLPLNMNQMSAIPLQAAGQVNMSSLMGNNGFFQLLSAMLGSMQQGCNASTLNEGILNNENSIQNLLFQGNESCDSEEKSKIPEELLQAIIMMSGNMNVQEIINPNQIGLNQQNIESLNLGLESVLSKIMPANIKSNQDQLKKSQIDMTNFSELNNTADDKNVQTDLEFNLPQNKAINETNAVHQNIEKMNVLEKEPITKEETPTTKNQINIQDAAEVVSNKLSSNQTIIDVTDKSHDLSRPIIKQVANSIAYNLNKDKSEFTMQLFPKELGKISVKLVSENGMLTVHLIADNPKTQNMLMSNINEIKSLLQTSYETNQQIKIVENSRQDYFNSEQHQNYLNQNSQQDRQNNQNKERQQNQQQQNYQDNERENKTTAADFISLFNTLNGMKNRYTI